jgi:hypothetical protein
MDPQLPPPQRRLDEVCAPGYTGRKRGEVVRSRTTVVQAHSYQWLGTFGNPGNGHYRKELRRAVEAIQSYLRAHHLEDSCVLLRLDGLYGNGAILTDLLGFAFVMRSKDYQLMDLPIVQTRLHLPSDQQFTLPESHLIRTLYDCPDVPIGPNGPSFRLVVASHPKGLTKKRIGVERDGLIYELFLTKLPQGAFTASDVVALYLHRGSFETTLSDEASCTGGAPFRMKKHSMDSVGTLRRKDPNTENDVNHKAVKLEDEAVFGCLEEPLIVAPIGEARRGKSHVERHPVGDLSG